MRAQHERMLAVGQDHPPDASLSGTVHRLSDDPERLVADFAIRRDVVGVFEVDEVHLIGIDEPR